MNSNTSADQRTVSMLDAATSPVSLSIITAHKGYTTKRFLVGSAGQPLKDPRRQLWITSGTLEYRTVCGLEGLKTLLSTITPATRQALVHGVPRDLTHAPLWELVTEKRYTGAPTTIARIKKHLHYPDGTKLLMDDYDPEDSPLAPVGSAEDLVARLAAIWPAFGEAGYLSTYSTSSSLKDRTTHAWLIPPAGMHVYRLVTGDVERFREILKARLWLAGEGFYKLATPNEATGVAAILPRYLLDMAVYSPERLDFVSGADIPDKAPFYQDRPEPVLHPGAVLDLDTFPDLTPAEDAAAQRLMAAARAALAPQQRETVRARIRTQHPEMDDTQTDTEATARLERAARGVLLPDHPLYFDHGKVVLAGAVTKALDRMTLADPQEPTYGMGKAILYMNEGGASIRIHSLAHGISTTYRILPTPQATPRAGGVGDLPLQCARDGTTLETIGNLLKIFRHHPAWHDRLWLDSVRTRPMLDTQPLTDHDAITVAEWLGDTYDMRCRHPRLLLACLEAVCTEHPRDRLRAWIEALPPWDETQRLHDWLHTVAGVQPGVYCTAVSRLFLLALVARALDPGAICRTVVILQGPEDTGKSSLLHDLVGEDWYIETSGALEGKEPHLLIQGVWLCELSELDSLTRTEENRLKSFLTMRMDSYLPKYSNTRVDIPRRTVFVGTTNDETYLKGQTGNTRFFPVKTGRIDLPVLHTMRDQLFAEAVHVYQEDPAHWWALTPEVLALVKAEREERRVTSVYENALSGWLQEKDKTTWEDIARYFLLLETPERWKDRALQMEIAKALKALGWTRGPMEADGTVRRRYWHAPQAEAEPDQPGQP